MSRWSEAYLPARQACEEALSEVAASTEAVAKAREWESDRQELEGDCKKRVAGAWKRSLARRAWLVRFGSKIFVLVRKIDPRSNRLKEEVRGYRKDVARLRKMPRSSRPAQAYHLGILYLRVRLLFTWGRVVLLLLAAAILLLDNTYPTWIEDLLDLFHPRSAGP